MSHTPHKPLAEGCDQQSRYTTRKPQLVDVMPRDYQPPTDRELFRRADDAVIARFRNGQPKAGEAVFVSDDKPSVSVDGVITVLMWVMAAIVMLIIGGNLIAWAWPTVRGWLA